VRALLAVGLSGALPGCAPQPSAPESGPASPTRTKTGALPIESPAKDAKEIAFKTKDGWTIKGDLYSPAGAAKGAVVLLHQRGGSAQDWKPLCLALQKAGLTALAIDQRGAGRSTQGPGPTGADAPWLTSNDIAAALAQLSGKGPFGLAGASYGANNALIYAAAHPDKVLGVALFSPGANYHGLDALRPARAYHGSVLIYHATGDEIAGTGPKQIDNALTSAEHTLHLVEGSGHGTALLDARATTETVAFFQHVLH
jgi:dienelactone hydrolase